MRWELKYQASSKDLIEITLPLSKSILNRNQIISFLSGQNLPIDKDIIPHDNLILAEQLELIKNGRGTGGNLNVSDSGTAMRFLISLLCIVPGTWILDGSSRIRQRPVLHLTEELLSMGGKIVYLGKKGFLPLKIDSSKLINKNVSLPGNISSQYISSLMLIAPYLEEGLTINIDKDQVSMPYIKMTYGLMKELGAEIEMTERDIIIQKSSYRNAVLLNERDWSAASYWYLLASLLPGKKFRLKDISLNSLQGDSICHSLFKSFGVSTIINDDSVIIERTGKPAVEIDIDLKDYPDIAPSLIVASAALDIPSVYKGLHHLKFKESDRLTVLKNELTRMGFNVSSDTNSFTVRKQINKLKTLVINTNGDHRILMSLIPLIILIPRLSIDNRDCVQKSYPGFYADVENVGILIN